MRQTTVSKSYLTSQYRDAHGIRDGYDPRLFSKENIQRLLANIGSDAGIAVVFEKEEVASVNFIPHAQYYAGVFIDDATVTMRIFPTAGDIVAAIDDCHEPEGEDMPDEEGLIYTYLRMLILLENEMVRESSPESFRYIAHDSVLESSLAGCN